MTLYRGYSLSGCIRDIIEGRRNADDVAEIVAGTYIDSAEALEEVIKGYQYLYWQRDPERGANLAREFFAEGLITQPRLMGLNPPMHAGRSLWDEWDFTKDTVGVVSQ